MDEHIIPFSGDKLVKVKQIQKDYYRVSLDHTFIGHICKVNGGWQLEEYSKAELTAENVQLIGDQIDGLRWQLTQFY
ncbi:MAG: hypothetical protein ABI203_00280 [Mucilaginibacter sp.]